MNKSSRRWWVCWQAKKKKKKNYHAVNVHSSFCCYQAKTKQTNEKKTHHILLYFEATASPSPYTPQCSKGIESLWNCEMKIFKCYKHNHHPVMRTFKAEREKKEMTKALIIQTSCPAHACYTFDIHVLCLIDVM